MKSTLTKTIFAAISLGAFWVSGWGSAQAAPVCSPTYSITSTNVTLLANCTPDPGESINFANGYDWDKDGVSVGITGLITQATSAADTHNYKVRAQNAPAAGFGAFSAAVTVVAGPPSPCNLKVQVAGGAPSAGPVTIAPGASATLIPTCHGSDSLDWYSDVGGSGFTQIIDPPGGIVFPATGTTKYKVVGSNDYGDSASGEVTVNAVVPIAKSDCSSISPSTPSVTLGSNSPVLTASCNNSPTSYVWKLNGSTLGGCSGSTCTVSSSNLPSVTTYGVTVTANNAGGTGTTAASATITVSSVALSACTSISPASPSVTLGSASPALSANCNNSPSAYVWKLNGSNLSCTGSSCTVPAGSLPSATTYGVTVSANNAGGVGTQSANATLTVSDAEPPPVAGCTIKPVTWASTVQIGVTPLQTMNNGSTYAFAVQYGSSATGKAGLLYSSPGTVGKLVTLSKTPCAFAGADVGTSCSATSRDNNPTVNYSTAVTNACKITAGTWYINVRNSKNPTGTDECQAGAKCTYYVLW